MEQMGTLIFACATDERSLMVFDEERSAIAYCESIDVEDGGWRFWDNEGMALAAEFLTPNYRNGRTVGNGTYRLTLDPGLPSLANVLTSVLSLEPNPYFATLSEIESRMTLASDMHPAS